VLSRLHRDKRIELAIAAARELRDVEVIVAGSGPAEDDLRRSARGAPVRFLGHIDDPLLVLHAADALVLASGRRAGEGLPMSILEAAAAGVPTVATVDSGVAEVVRAAGGRATAPTPRALADGLRAAIGDASAPSAARRWAEQHAEPAWIDGYLSVLLGTVPSERRAGRAPRSR
jgi:alpha-1,6-mannosyltransferase